MHSRRWRAQRAIINFSSEHRTTCSLCLPRIPMRAINAGYMMEDLVLKLTELDIDTCWMTFTDSDKIKQALSLATSPVRGGGNRFWLRGKDHAKKLRLNILSMSQIDVRAEQQYYAPKKGCARFGSHMGSWRQQVKR